MKNKIIVFILVVSFAGLISVSPDALAASSDSQTTQRFQQQLQQIQTQLASIQVALNSLLAAKATTEAETSTKSEKSKKSEESATSTTPATPATPAQPTTPAAPAQPSPGTETPATPTAPAQSDLQIGSSGEDVKILQMFLKKYPELYPEGLVTGYYSGFTESAVKRLQMQCNVKPNGKISPKIVHIMKEVYVCDVLEVCGILEIRGVLTVGPCPPPPEAITNNLQRDSSGNDVKKLQTLLKKSPDIYPEGLVTGYFGSLTEKAVKKFQEKYAEEILVPQGLNEGTGVVGEKTRAKVNELSTEKKITICHIPPGKPENKQTLEIDESALNAHLAHGDTVGVCGEKPTPPPPTPPAPPAPCTESWNCGEWSSCANGTQTRICTDTKNCGTTNTKPILSQSCAPPPPPTPPPPPPVLSDLIVSSISPIYTYADAQNKITVNLKNIGLGLAPKNFIVAIYVDNNLIGELSYSNDILANATGTVSVDYTFSAGSHQIKAVVDSTNLVSESDEANNELTYAVNLTPITALPDLVISSISTTHNYINTLNRAYVSFKNIGFQVARNFSVKVYMDGFFAKEQIFSGDILANGTGGMSVDYTFTTTGPHEIKAIVDTANQITEINETNNERAYAINIVSPAPVLSDLIISSISTTYNYINTLNRIYVSFKNIGYEIARNFVTKVYVDGVLAKEQAYSGDVLANNTGGVSVDYTFTTTGPHEIKAIVDATNLLAEINETNNEMAYAVNIAPTSALPDLNISSIYIIHNYANVRNPIYVHFGNIGFDTSGSFIGKLYIDDVLIKEQILSGVQANGAAGMSIDYTFTAGPHQIKAVADTANSIAEINENNNERVYTVNILAPSPALPDLNVSSIYTTGSNYAGVLNQIYIHFGNVGFQPAGSFIAKIYVDDVLVKEQTLSGVSVGSAVGMSLPYTFTTGSHQIKVVADTANSVAEINENNNELAWTVNILATSLTLPDLAVSSIYTIHNYANTRNSVYIHFSNIGFQPAGSFIAKIYVDDVLAKEQTLSGVSVGSAVGMSFDYTFTTGGPHQIKAVADTANSIAEINENNNERVYVLNVLVPASQLPDLVISSISTTHNYINTLNRIYISFKNAGYAVTRNFVTKVYVDSVLAKEQTYSADILANSTGGMSVDYTFTSVGPHQIKAVVDATNLVAEINETNNEMAYTENFVSSQ